MIDTHTIKWDTKSLLNILDLSEGKGKFAFCNHQLFKSLRFLKGLRFLKSLRGYTKRGRILVCHLKGLRFLKSLRFLVKVRNILNV